MTVSAAACQHVKSLRGSLTSLTHVKYNGASATKISADVKNIQAQLTALKSQPEFASAANQLDASVNQVEQAAHNAMASPTSAEVKAVIKALDGLKTTATPMISQLKVACP